MTAHSLQDIAPGFVDITVQSQGVFRSALDALARPGSIARLPSVPANPVLPRGSSAAASLLLALLDQDCSLWVSPALAAGHGAEGLEDGGAEEGRFDAGGDGRGRGGGGVLAHAASVGTGNLGGGTTTAEGEWAMEAWGR